MAIIDWIPEPKFGDKEKQQKEDELYNQPLEKPLDQTKDELKSLFWDFSRIQNNNESWITPEEMNEDILKNTKTEAQIQEEYHNSLPDYSDTWIENITLSNNDEVEVEWWTDFWAPWIEVKDWPEIESVEDRFLEDLEYYPILKSLNDSWNINNKAFEDWLNQLSQVDKEDSKLVLEKIIWKIDWLDIKEKSDILKWIKITEQVTEENFENTDFYKDFQNAETWSKPEWRQIDLLLAESYTKIPNNSLWDNLSVTMEVTLNKIISKQSETFREQNSSLISDIRSEKSYWKKYSLLSQLNSIKIDWDAKWLKWLDNSFKKWQEKKNNVEMSLNDKFNKFKQEVKEAQKLNDQSKIKDFLNEAKVLKEEAEEKWDIFVSSDIDILVNSLNEWKEQA